MPKSKPQAPAAARRRLSWGQRGLLFLFGCGLLVLVELGLRLFGVGGDAADPLAGFAGERLFRRGASVADGREVYQLNPAYRNTFNAEEFAVERQDGALRVFCFGGSSTFGFPIGADASFSRWLREWLEALQPERSIEVVNVGGVSYASHRVRLLMQEIVAYAPDLFVVYSGHNEFVERNFYEDVLRGDSWLVWADATAARWSRLYAVARGAMRGARERAAGPSAGAEGDMAFDVVVRRRTRDNDAENREETLAGYRTNLLGMVELARQYDVPLVLLTTPPNLRDWAPDGSRHREGLTPAQQRQFDTLVNAGVAALDAADAPRALAQLRQALAIDDQHAMAWYRLGRAHEAVEQWDAAADAYSRARDLDALPIRALSAMAETVRAVAAETATPLIDVETAFRAASPHGLIGRDMVMDYVHPTVRGHQVIATEVARWMVGAGHAAATTATFDAVAPAVQQALEAAGRELAERAESSPTEALNRAFALRNEGRLEEAIAAAWHATTLHPDWAIAQQALATLYYDNGMAREAEDAYRASLELDPRDDRTLLGLAVLLIQTGRGPQAETFLRQALAVRPDSAEVLVTLGELLGMLERNDEALTALERAVALEPDNLTGLADLGTVLQRMGRIDEATARYRDVLARQPSHPAANFNLGNVLLQQGRPADAVAHLRTAAEADSPAPGAAAALARVLQGQRRYGEAKAAWELAVASAPKDAKSVHGLAWLLATCAGDGVRDPGRALKLAQQLRGMGPEHPIGVAALAAAQAANQRFDDAVASATRAVQLAQKMGLGQVAQEVQQQLQSYRARRPLRLP
ncbi:MAG: tetratricopeptide repeat protein [Planctomycetota bacterium]